MLNHNKFVGLAVVLCFFGCTTTSVEPPAPPPVAPSPMAEPPEPPPPSTPASKVPTANEEAKKNASLLKEKEAKEILKQFQQAQRAYENGDYALANRLFKKILVNHALKHKEKTISLKLLAFMSCSNHQIDQCRQYFVRLLQIAPNFKLNPSEASHPVWGATFEDARKSRK